MNNARELSSRLLDLLRREQSAMAEFLVALADFDRNRTWAELGHTSLFYFLRRELRLSAGAAFYRKVAAELIQRFPEVVEPLRNGRLCLTSVAELAKVLTPQNCSDVLPRFFHASKQEAKAVAAEISPRQGAPHRMVVTAVAPVARARQAEAASVRLAAGHIAPLTTRASPELALGQNPVRLDEVPHARGSAVSPPAPPIPPAPPRTSIEPLTADLRRIHVTVSKRFMEKLETARDALSHSHPGADAEAILEAGLDLLIERAAKRKGCTRPKAERVAPKNQLDGEGRGRSEQPRQQSRNPSFIPAAVKREVWLRDGARCQFKLANGELCGATNRLQFDHIRPVALGGKPTASNLRLACAPHNLLAARRVFGDALIDRYAPARTTGALPEAR